MPFGPNFSANFATFSEPEPVIRIGSGGLARRTPNVTEKLVVLQVRGKITVEKKLPIKGKIIADVILTAVTKIKMLFPLPISGKIIASEPLVVSSRISAETSLQIKGKISSEILLPIRFTVKFTMQKLLDILKIIDSVKSMDDFQLATQTFTFVLGASGDDRELDFEKPSSFVGKVVYTPDLQSMEVILNGFTYNYCGVPQRIFDQFAEASSKGEFYNREIKGVYLC